MSAQVNDAVGSPDFSLTSFMVSIENDASNEEDPAFRLHPDWQIHLQLLRIFCNPENREILEGIDFLRKIEIGELGEVKGAGDHVIDMISNLASVLQRITVCSDPFIQESDIYLNQKIQAFKIFMHHIVSLFKKDPAAYTTALEFRKRVEWIASI